MTFTGGLGEHYCSQQCYDAGGATVTKHLLQNWTGDCSVCRGPVSLQTGSRASMVCWKPGHLLFHCGSPSCVDAVRSHVQQTDVCAICGNPLEANKQKQQQEEAHKSEDTALDTGQASEESQTSKDPFEETFKDISQEIAGQIINQITQYTQMWLKVLQVKFPIAHNKIDKNSLKSIICDISRYIFIIKEDNRFTDESLESLINSIYQKLQSGLQLEIATYEANSYFDRLEKAKKQCSSDYEMHKAHINTLFIPVYQYITGRSAKEISEWCENDGAALFSLYFVFYHDIKLIIGNVLNNNALIKEANKDRKKWLTEVSTDIYPHEFNKPCFIASAVYGSTSAHEVVILRNFRDRVMLQYLWGKLLVDCYYKVGPKLASKIINRILLKKIIKYLLCPLVSLSQKIIEKKNNI